MTKVDTHAPGTICWVDLMTSDAETARTFYKALFGWTFLLDDTAPGHYALAQLDDRPAAGVGPLPDGAPLSPAWSVYFASDDLDATLATVTARGGRVMAGPMDVIEEGRMAVCMDPSGAAFCVWQAKRHVGARVIDEPNAMCWYEVFTPDAAKACDFYGSVFGLEARRLVEEGEPTLVFYTLHKGDKIVGGVEQTASGAPAWRIYFAVADADAAAARITELGGSITVPPLDTPYGRMAVVADPTGAGFAIIKLAS
jgi:predicted enzyme related to lactoylglutathione lyase